MNSSIDHCDKVPSAAHGFAALVAQLKAAARTGQFRSLLTGKNLGLLCGDPTQPEVLRLYRAGADLGARVSLVRPRFGGAEIDAQLGDTVRTLGRLYNVLACVGVAPSVVSRLRADAGVPVLDETTAHFANAATGATDGESAADEDDHVFLWQAGLVSIIA